MGTASIWLAAALLGVAYGYRPIEEQPGKYEYIVQVEPEVYNHAAKPDAPWIGSNIPEAVRSKIARVRVVVGDDELPRELTAEDAANRSKQAPITHTVRQVSGQVDQQIQSVYEQQQSAWAQSQQQAQQLAEQQKTLGTEARDLGQKVVGELRDLGDATKGTAQNLTNAVRGAIPDMSAAPPAAPGSGKYVPGSYNWQYGANGGVQPPPGQAQAPQAQVSQPPFTPQTPYTPQPQAQAGQTGHATGGVPNGHFVGQNGQTQFGAGQQPGVGATPVSQATPNSQSGAAGQTGGVTTPGPGQQGAAQAQQAASPPSQPGQTNAGRGGQSIMIPIASAQDYGRGQMAPVPTPVIEGPQLGGQVNQQSGNGAGGAPAGSPSSEFKSNDFWKDFDSGPAVESPQTRVSARPVDSKETGDFSTPDFPTDRSGESSDKGLEELSESDGAEPESTKRPWAWLVMSIVLLGASVSGNLYLWTSYLDARNKYRAAMRRSSHIPSRMTSPA